MALDSSCWHFVSLCCFLSLFAMMTLMQHGLPRHPGREVLPSVCAGASC